MLPINVSGVSRGGGDREITRSDEDSTAIGPSRNILVMLPYIRVFPLPNILKDAMSHMLENSCVISTTTQKTIARIFHNLIYFHNGGWISVL